MEKIDKLIKKVDKYTKKSVKKAYQVVLLLISFALIYFFNIPSFVIILMAVFFGVIWYFIQKKINKSGEKNA